ncbi:MAG: hypothetical protein H6Q93_938 [Nitrospirae bacterium]|nr:hypothetical protein [Nitrospirota bacterium]
MSKRQSGKYAAYVSCKCLTKDASAHRRIRRGEQIKIFFHTSPHFFTNAYFGLIQFSVYLLNLNEIFTLRDIFFTPILLIFVIR